MAKFARIVLEVEIEDDATGEEILDQMERAMTGFLEDHWGIDDIEIDEHSYQEMKKLSR